MAIGMIADKAAAQRCIHVRREPKISKSQSHNSILVYTWVLRKGESGLGESGKKIPMNIAAT